LLALVALASLASRARHPKRCERPWRECAKTGWLLRGVFWAFWKNNTNQHMSVIVVPENNTNQHISVIVVPEPVTAITPPVRASVCVCVCVAGKTKQKNMWVVIVVIVTGIVCFI
jgi:hypothetical protein